MDAKDFDDLARLVAIRRPRRGFLKFLGATLLGVAGKSTNSLAASEPPCLETGSPFVSNTDCCDGALCCPQDGSGSGTCTAPAPEAGESENSLVCPGEAAPALPPLPEPALLTPCGEASPDYISSMVSEAVHGGSVPMLLGVLQWAGIGIRDVDGSLKVEPAEPSLGLELQAAHVYQISFAIQQNFRTRLGDLVEAIALGVFGEDGFPEGSRAQELADLVWQDIVALRDAELDTSRALGELIGSSLALSSRVPPEDRAAFPAKDRQAGPLAITLIPLVIALDLYRFAAEEATPVAEARAVLPDKGSAGLATAEGIRAQQGHPCLPVGIEGTISDAVAVASGEVFTYIVKKMVEEGDLRLLPYAQKLGVANQILAYGQLVLSLAAFGLKIDIDKNPLERTKETCCDGERAILTAEATFDFGHPDAAFAINCLRPVLNGLGIDFSLPNQGPIPDARVYWRLMEGGASGINVDPGFVQWGLGGGGSGRDPRWQKTDARGISWMRIEGRRQSQKLGPAPQPVYKTAWVDVDVYIKSNDLFQDFIDGLGIAACGRLNIGVLIFCSIPAMIYRTSAFWSRSFMFQVIDWESCPAERQCGDQCCYEGMECKSKTLRQGGVVGVCCPTGGSICSEDGNAQCCDAGSSCCGVTCCGAGSRCRESELNPGSQTCYCNPWEPNYPDDCPPPHTGDFRR